MISTLKTAELSCASVLPLSESLRRVQPCVVPHRDARSLRARQRGNPNLACAGATKHSRALASGRACGVNIVHQQHLAVWYDRLRVHQKRALDISPAADGVEPE